MEHRHVIVEKPKEVNFTGNPVMCPRPARLRCSCHPLILFFSLITSKWKKIIWDQLANSLCHSAQLSPQLFFCCCGNRNPFASQVYPVGPGEKGWLYWQASGHNRTVKWICYCSYSLLSRAALRLGMLEIVSCYQDSNIWSFAFQPFPYDIGHCYVTYTFSSGPRAFTKEPLWTIIAIIFGQHMGYRSWTDYGTRKNHHRWLICRA